MKIYSGSHVLQISEKISFYHNIVTKKQHTLVNNFFFSLQQQMKQLLTVHDHATVIGSNPGLNLNKKAEKDSHNKKFF